MRSPPFSPLIFFRPAFISASLIFQISSGLAQLQPVPAFDRKGRLLLEIIDTLERDLEHLSHQKRELERKKDEMEQELASLQKQCLMLERDLAATRGQISKLLRSIALMKEPDDLLLLFSTFKYHDLHVYRRNIRMITSKLTRKLVRLLQKQKEINRRKARAEHELEELSAKRQAVLEQIQSLEATTQRTRLELTERTRKIATIENLFMQSNLESPVSTQERKGASPFQGTPPPPDLGELEGKHELQLPISPGRLVKKFDEIPNPPIGNEKMVRGWILVPFVTGKKKGTTNVAFVRAPYEGIVVFVGEVPGFGLTIVLDHGREFHSVYSNLHKVHVVKGDRVQREQTLATIKSLNPGTELPYLYFELRRRRLAVDPKPWFRLRPLADSQRK